MPLTGEEETMPRELHAQYSDEKSRSADGPSVPEVDSGV